MIIGIDPHKMSHTANAVDPATNTTAASLRIDASLARYRELMRWAKQFPDRRWAVENARWLGRHLAQWLVARGEVVLDVPSTATARVRELSRGSRRKTDVIDAAAAASFAALHGDATVNRPGFCVRSSMILRGFRDTYEEGGHGRVQGAVGPFRVRDRAHRNSPGVLIEFPHL